jgi:predicted nucleic-acid-binding protein
MLLIDTNIILRYLLNDSDEFSQKAKDVILNNDALIVTQVIAEVIYVLKGVYASTKQEIVDGLLSICSMDNVQLENEEIVVFSLKLFLETNLDFVDALLISYQKFTGRKVVTFDRKLLSKISELLEH